MPSRRPTAPGEPHPTPDMTEAAVSALPPGVPRGRGRRHRHTPPGPPGPQRGVRGDGRRRAGPRGADPPAAGRGAGRHGGRGAAGARGEGGAGLPVGCAMCVCVCRVPCVPCRRGDVGSGRGG